MGKRYIAFASQLAVRQNHLRERTCGKLTDTTPIGINVRSTVATYADVHDELRKVYARTAEQKRGYKAGDFSHNTGSLRCPTHDGTGIIDLDVQFLPDVKIPSSLERDGFKPVLIIYNMDTISNVLEKFVSILEDRELHDSDGIYEAIGFIFRKEDTAGIKISSYWAGFNGTKQ